MKAGRKIYFASDLHLGVPDYESSLVREKKFVLWLDTVKGDAEEIHLVGDVFDFWFEYKRVVPRGFVRLLGKIAELSDSGIKIFWYLGNHDMWIFDYIPKELGVTMLDGEVSREFNGKRFHIAHGDGLGPGDNGYKFLKKVFRSRLCQWLFARLHPNFGIGLADTFSRRSREIEVDKDAVFLGEEKEWLLIHSKEVLKNQEVDYFIYGHRHYPLDLEIGEGTRCINLGDWITHFTYAVFDGVNLELKSYN
ncbi:MAG: UDP-2,3-diacylglucosamine diphosphatase [Bacteroidetes bacterium]|jgi:UDP-2,3-diacylglucosamine hydrolase|nr:UDP-2,3-diacylglucosamine diphosphatase [Bacteroidota bacterium]